MAPSKKSKQLYLDVGKVIDAECDPKNIKYKDQLSNEEILTVTPMTFVEEAVAVFLFVFGVPGAAYSVSSTRNELSLFFISVSLSFCWCYVYLAIWLSVYL